MCVMDCVKVVQWPPMLFSLYFVAVVDDWRSKCSVAWVEFRYKYGHKLVGDRTIKSRLLLDIITESQFADDAALYATEFPNCGSVLFKCYQ